MKQQLQWSGPKAYFVTYRNDKDGINRNGLRGIGSLEPLGIGTESNIQA